MPFRRGFKFSSSKILSLSTQFWKEIKEDCCRNLFSSDYSRTILLFLVLLNHGNFYLFFFLVDDYWSKQSQLNRFPATIFSSTAHSFQYFFDPMLSHHVCTSLVYHTISIIMSHIVFYAHFVFPSKFLKFSERNIFFMIHVNVNTFGVFRQWRENLLVISWKSFHPPRRNCLCLLIYRHIFPDISLHKSVY